MKPPSKVIVVTSIPTPYRVPLFNVMHEILASDGFSLEVLFWTEYYERRKWKDTLSDAVFTRSILKSWRIRLSEEWYLFLPINLFSVLLRMRPRVIIAAGFSISTLIVFLYHVMSKVPYVIWSGETMREATKISSLQTFMRKVLIKSASAAVVYGTQAGEYVRAVDRDTPIFYGWNTVDTDFFSKAIQKTREEKMNLIGTLGITPSHTNILTVGYLVRRKGIAHLLHALRVVRDTGSDFILHIVGDGPERSNLARMTDEFHLQRHVRFWGNKERRELLSILAISDIFVFPSLSDIWGLAPIEAMAAGLPVIASKYAGSTHDLVEHGENGFIIDPYNVREFADMLILLLQDAQLRLRMGRNAQKTIESKFTLARSVQGFRDAVKHVVQAEHGAD